MHRKRVLGALIVIHPYLGLAFCLIFLIWFASGMAETGNSRIERWLYRGLHSLDFPRLYQTAWAWDAVIVGLSLGGVALSLTAVIIGWRFLRRRTAGSADADLALTRSA